MAFTPDGKTAYITCTWTVPSTVTPISTATNTAGKPIHIGTRDLDIAITPDGKTVYAAGGGVHTITPISTATNTPGKADPRPAAPEPLMAITPDGKTIYVDVSQVRHGHPGQHRD